MSAAAPRAAIPASAAADTRERVLSTIRANERFVLVTHEHPDGDALGSLVGMHGVLTELGKDSVMYMSADEFPLPYEYRFFQLDGLVCVIPDDLEQRVVIFLDCGNIDRNTAPALQAAEPLLNIDHHHDNTHFGSIDHVVPGAACTAEVVWDLMPSLGVELNGPIADALYVGLITDTGRFSYENTGTRSHLMAADLVAAGVDVAGIYRRIYEGTPYAKLELLGRALQRVTRYDAGRLAVAFLTAEDFRATGAEESHSEGIIDQLRAVEGTKCAVLVRELLSEEKRGQKKVSMRATDDDVDVSIIARAHRGGGHRRAAGFTTHLSLPALIDELREQLTVQLS